MVGWLGRISVRSEVVVYNVRACVRTTHNTRIWVWETLEEYEVDWDSWARSVLNILKFSYYLTLDWDSRNKY